MEPAVCLLIVFLLVAICLLIAGGIMGAIALNRVGELQKKLSQVTFELDSLSIQVHRLPPPTLAPPPAPPSAPPSTHAAVAPPDIPIPPPTPVTPLTPPRPAWKPPPRPHAHPTSSPASPIGGLEQLESKIGLRWIAWVGAIVVFFSVVFFLKYAFDNDWIGPTGQVVICALGGAALAATGSRFISKHWPILGQTLIGLGIAILYATFFAAFQIYDPPVMNQAGAFAAMIAVTIAGMSLAILHDALPLAFIAVFGGLLSPLLVRTGIDPRDPLFAYLVLLDLGVTAVAFYRRWRMLDTLAMAGTFILYAGWFAEFYKSEALIPALTWLAAIYLIFLILPFVYHLVRRQSVTVERFIMALANAAFAASFAWYMLRDQYLFTMGFISLGMAAAYLVLGALIRRRLPMDASALFGTIVMSVTFLTLAVPMQLHAHGIMLAWVAEAPVLAFLAYRFRYEPLRVLAAGVLILGLARLFGSEVHWPLHKETYILFFNRQFLSAMAVPAAAALYALVHQLHSKQSTPADRGLKLAAALGAGFLALFLVYSELCVWLNREYGDYISQCAATTLWAAGALAYLFSGRPAARAAPWTWGVGAVALLTALGFAVNAFSVEDPPQHILFANSRFAAALLAIAAGFLYARAFARSGHGIESPGIVLGIVALVASILGLLILLSTEVYTFCIDVMPEGIAAQRAGQMSITLVWSLYAATMLFLGFLHRWRALRLGSLALFGIAAAKLALVDLAFLRDIYRIVSFLVLGMLMLLASYVYHRLEKRLTSAKGDPPPADPPPAIGETP